MVRPVNFTAKTLAPLLVESVAATLALVDVDDDVAEVCDATLASVEVTTADVDAMVTVAVPSSTVK